MKRAAVVTLTLLLVVAAVLLGRAQQSDEPPILAGVFTNDQVQRGKALYESRCALCHGFELIADDPEAGDLTAIQFRLNWQGKTLAERHERTSTTMPPGNADVLTAQEHLDIITYILNFNGYPTGDKELTPDPARLEQIVIAPLPAK